MAASGPPIKVTVRLRLADSADSRVRFPARVGIRQVTTPAPDGGDRRLSGSQMRLNTAMSGMHCLARRSGGLRQRRKSPFI